MRSFMECVHFRLVLLKTRGSAVSPEPEFCTSSAGKRTPLPLSDSAEQPCALWHPGFRDCCQAADNEHYILCCFASSLERC